MRSSVSIHQLPPIRDDATRARKAISAAVNGRISTTTADRISYAKDMWPLGLLWARQQKIPSPADVIVWPESEHELQALVVVAREHRLPLIPYGAGSGVCGGTWALNGGIIVDLKRFDSVGRVDASSHTVNIGAGVLGTVVEQELNAQGWTLGHFPSSIAMSTVGGWLATRSAGQCSSRYGKIEDMVRSVRAVLGTGEVVETPSLPTGQPDVTQLLVGSEGTLGLLTSATFTVHRVAPSRLFMSYLFDSVEKGVEAIRLMFRHGLRPAVVRLYDPFDTAVVGNHSTEPVAKVKTVTPPSERGFFQKVALPRVLKAVSQRTLGRPLLLNALQGTFKKSRLIVIFEGEEVIASTEAAHAHDLALKCGATFTGDGPARDWLTRRYDVVFKMHRLLEAGNFVDTFEVAAPWDRVLSVYDSVRTAVASWAFVLCHFSHAYADGCSLYFSLIGSGANEAEVEARYDRMWSAAVGAAVAAGANVSHHHGIGLLKRDALASGLGDARHVLAAFKRQCDPDGIMNPGKLWGTT